MQKAPTISREVGEPVTPGRAKTPPGISLLDLVNATIQTAAADPNNPLLPIEEELEVIPRGPEWFQFIQDDLERCRARLDKNYESYEDEYLTPIHDRVSALYSATLLTQPLVDNFDLSFVSICRFIEDLKKRLAKYNVEIDESLQAYLDSLIG